MESVWGADFTLETLREKHDAVFIGIGAWRSQSLRCEGEDLALSGIRFLEDVAKNNPPPLGDQVIVVGGGNTAMDAARTAIRLGAKVKVIYRRSRQEMPCLMEEVEEAEHEGVDIDLLVAPLRLEKKNGLLELTCQRMKLGEPDESGRRRPVPEPGTEFTMECTAVIAAIGQSVETSLAEREGLEVTRWGIAADSQTLATNLPDVFSGGDAVLGADLAVRAVAAGRIAAISIDQFLTGRAVMGPEEIGKCRNADHRRRRAGRPFPRDRSKLPSPHRDDRHGPQNHELRRSGRRFVGRSGLSRITSLYDLRLPQRSGMPDATLRHRVPGRPVSLRG